MRTGSKKASGWMEKDLKKYLANVLTSARILCGMWMLFTPVFSVPFWTAYLVGGVTDMMDGAVARKTNTATAFGAYLDSAADAIFLGAALIRICPAIAIPRWTWGCIMVILIIRLINIGQGVIRYKRVVLMHTGMNKVTGLLLFVLPLTLPFVNASYSAGVVCAAATLAALQEGHCIGCGDEAGPG